MVLQIKKAAVIGAGVMGASIAAHLANVGIPCYLFDIVPQSLTPEEESKGLTLAHPAVRNRIAIRGKEGLLKQKPAPLYTKEDADLITPVNLDDHLNALSEVDWVLECVVENLKIKKELYQKITEYIKPGTIVSTNTSGLSLESMSENMPPEMKKYFLGTHFFNPPRYMKLLEVIPAKETLPEVVDYLAWFGDHILGKGIVMCKDTPNFIANRIGVNSMLAVLKLVEQEGLTVEEVDAVSGSLMGRPNSSCFGTLDLVGLDVLAHIIRNMSETMTDPAEKEMLTIPPWYQKMLDNNWLGNKTKGGFYKKVQTDQGKETLVLNYKTMNYEPQKKIKYDSIDAALKAKGLPDKLNALLFGNDKASELAWKIQKAVLLYSAHKLPEIAEDIRAVDTALRLGFNYELGPFETWDAIGVEKIVSRLKTEGEAIPAVVQELLEAGGKSFYKYEKGQLSYYDYKTKEFKPEKEHPGLIILKSLKEREKVVKSNNGASLIDLGDGVVCLEIHTPKQVLNDDLVEMIEYGVQEAEKNFIGMVVGSQSKNFCLGADLALVLTEARNGNWESIEKRAKRLQGAITLLKYSVKPVVAAPYVMTLGGGAEICLGSNRIVAAGETYLGLVEIGVGVLPAGGGCKELLIRNTEHVPDDKIDLQPFVNRAFETIVMAKTSTSGREAQRLGLMRETDRVITNQDYLINEAKKSVLAMSLEGYNPPRPRKIRVVGETGLAVLKLGLWMMQEGGFISGHDMTVGNKVAYVLCGGKLPANTFVTEQYLLDLEREAFMSLIGEPKTQARMEHMLSKGKPLRN